MASLLATDYSVRAPTPEDVPSVLDLLAACDTADFGEAEHHEPDDVQRWWREEETELVFTPEGRLAGYTSLYDGDNQHTKFHSSVFVQPDLRAGGLAVALVERVEQRAREIARQAPAEAEVTLRQGFGSPDQQRRALLESRGYALARAFWRMRIDMSEPPPAPEVPEGITIRTYQVGPDDRAVYDAVEEAFRDHWDYHMTPYEEWLERFEKPDFDPALWFLAMEGDQIAGVTLCTKEPSKGWINKVAVRRPWRKRGVGMTLLRQAFGAFWERGVTRVELGVDAQSLTNAQVLYQRAGMHPAAEWSIYAKVLRAGTPGES